MKGTWHKIEMRVKLNDIGSSNGEFIFFFDDQLKVHLTDMSNMVPDGTFEITHARFYVFNNWPGTQNDGSFYFKNYYLTSFSSDVSTPNVFTTEAPTDDTQTTHPITTTAQPGKFDRVNINFGLQLAFQMPFSAKNFSLAIIHGVMRCFLKKLSHKNSRP